MNALVQRAVNVSGNFIETDAHKNSARKAPQRQKVISSHDEVKSITIRPSELA